MQHATVRDFKYADALPLDQSSMAGPRAEGEKGSVNALYFAIESILSTSPVGAWTCTRLQVTLLASQFDIAWRVER